jgi:hypothetical protein
MAIETKYICDKCGHTQATNNQMWHICIGHGHAEGNYDPAYYKTHQQLWCRKCIEKVGILCGDANPKEQTPPQLPPSLEDIMREIMREEIANVTGAC